MDERILQLQIDADRLARRIAESNERQGQEIATLLDRIDAIAGGEAAPAPTPSITETLDQCEREKELLRAHAGNLERHLDTLRNHLATAQTDAMESRKQVATLRELVVRYAVACAAVDLQQAMIRRDPLSARETLGDSLRQALQEERTASDALRTFARHIQTPIDRD
ncbi:MAG: hypothetical protein ACKO5K_10990 [Armatimonadota bacterium]